jgi:hypothetical protein
MALALLLGCAPPEIAPTCQSSSNCGALGQVQTCCTTTHCRFVVDDGTVFTCDGTECSAAHVAVAAYCAPHCPDASGAPDAWIEDDAALDSGPALDAQPCVR